MKKLGSIILIILFVGGYLLLSDGISFCEESADSGEMNLEDLSLEELLNMTVTSASKREQSFLDVANAMTVITREDIERSGARELPEIFRMVPGMTARHVDGHKYSVSIRGKADPFTRNLLVLIDGVVVYNPIFGGTWWESIPVSLDEVERIEIIRGTGGILYGVGAANGVINIITRSPKNDESYYVAYRTGQRHYNEVSLGGYYGLNDALKMRAYFDYDYDMGLSNSSGAFGRPTSGGENHIKRYNFGGRLEGDVSDMVNYKLMYKFAHNRFESFAYVPMRIEKQNNDLNSVSAEVSYNPVDWYNLDISSFVIHHESFFENSYDVSYTTFNLDVRNTFTYDMFGSHVTALGMSWRYNFVKSLDNIMRDTDVSEGILSMYLNEDWTLFEKLTLTLGGRIEHNTLAHETMISPRVAAVYKIDDRQSIRASVSRVYRTPCVGEENVQWAIAGGGYTYVGDADIEPERIWDFETGYKGFFFDNKLSFGAEAFLSKSKDFLDIQDSGANLNMVNNGKQQTWGFELNYGYKPFDWVELYGDYSNIHVNNRMESYSYNADEAQQSVPVNSIGQGIRFTYKGVKLDGYVKYIDSYRFVNITSHTIVKAGPVWKTMLRAAYGHKIKDINIEYELVLNDFLGTSYREDVSGYYVDEMLYGGVKLTF